MKLMTHLTIVAVATIACDGVADRPTTGADALALQSVVRDSAGVRIVDNPRPPVNSRLGWQVGAEPAVSIGALEGDEPYILDRVRDALTLADGRIVVRNLGTRELRVFDASGSHLATWGGAGDGPGEFNSLLGVDRWPGDSVIAWFSQGRRLSVFDDEGNFSRTFALEGQIHRSAEAVLPTGEILASETVLSESQQDGLRRPEELYELHGAQGESQASLGIFFGTESYREYSGTRIRVMSIPIRHRIAGFVWGTLVAVAPNYSYEIKAFGADGALKRIVRRDHQMIALTPAHLDAYIESRVMEVPERERAERRREERERYEDIPLPETHPAFVTAMADLLDYLWVREYDLPGEGGSNPLWTVFPWRHTPQSSDRVPYIEQKDGTWFLVLQGTARS